MANIEQELNYAEVFEKVKYAANDSEESLVNLLKESKQAREVCRLENEQPENCPFFKINDIQKHKIKKILQEHTASNEDNEFIDSDELYDQFLDSEEQEEIQKAKARRLEYFTKNKKDLVKLTLPSKTLEYLNKNNSHDKIKEKSFKKFFDLDKKLDLEEIRTKFFIEVHENYEKFMNEAFAAIILPYFTYAMSHFCIFKEDENNEDQILLTNIPHFISNYKFFTDFLKEFNGKANEASDDRIIPLRFSNDLLDLLEYYTAQCFEQSLAFILDDYCDISKATEEEFFKLSNDVIWDSYDIDFLTQSYFEILEELEMEEVFKIYNITDQNEVYDFCILDEKATIEEKEKIATWLDGFKTGTEKKVTIFDGNLYYQIIFTKENLITNVKGEEVKDSIIDLLWELATDFMIESSIIVNEITHLKNGKGIYQKKICGLLIQQGDFIFLPKEEVKGAYIGTDGELMVDSDCSFYDWYHSTPPENLIENS